VEKYIHSRCDCQPFIINSTAELIAVINKNKFLHKLLGNTTLGPAKDPSLAAE
jgi:hypothetical protein